MNKQKQQQEKICATWMLSIGAFEIRSLLIICAQLRKPTYRLTFIGSAKNAFCTNESRNDTSHELDLLEPHCMLYRITKNAEEITPVIMII